jgi:diguanylate cyclase (GGDEF)-like protein/PAS domain S-box-containing protein
MAKTKILIVEDESLVAWNIQNMLLSLGYEASAVVSTGEMAVQKARETHPHLVLMDIVLKGEMDGIAAARKIWEELGVPVVYLTAYADETTLERAKVTKPFGYLLKPFEEKELQSTIEMALYKSKMEKVLSERERWLSTVLRSIGDAVIATDKNGLVTFMNPVAESLTGWNPDESIKKPLNDVFSIRGEEHGEPIKILVKNVLRQKDWIFPKQSVLLVKNGAKLPIDLNAAFIKDDREETTGVVLVFRDITERKEHEKQLREQAIHDPLTKLPNRILFFDRLALAIAGAQRTQQKIAVMMLDLDHFKKVNDSMGHSTGDQLLKSVADRLETLKRKSDTVARLGGDEFMLLFPEIPRAEVASEIARRVLGAFQKAFEVGEKKVHITASIGISIYPDDGGDPDSLTKKADIAMYAVKASGRNNIRHYSPDMKTLEFE